jgi:nitric oxide reductase subunit B
MVRIQCIVTIGLCRILVFYHARNKEEEISEALPLEDPLRNMKPTPSMKATLKYIWVVALLILVQMLAGVITAHYGVEGSGFYGIPLDEFLPQSVSRSWHVQLAIFWIATSWLATGFILPRQFPDMSLNIRNWVSMYCLERY